MNFQKTLELLAIYVLRHRSGGGRCETGERESSERDLDVGGDLALVRVGDGERRGRKGGQTYGHTPRYGAVCLI